MIDRIFSGAVTRGATQREGKMSYTEFVWFLIAEEDKRHPTAIEYWYDFIPIYLCIYSFLWTYNELTQLDRTCIIPPTLDMPLLPS